MGDNSSWLVCDSKHLENLKNLLGVTEETAGAELRFSLAVTPEQKVFIFEARGRTWTFDDDEERKRLSTGREVFFCMVQDSVTAYEIAFRNDGVEVWKVAYFGEWGEDSLTERGTLPESLPRLKQACIESYMQDGGDEDGIANAFIDLPMMLAKEFTGYDRVIDGPEGDYFDWYCPQPKKLAGFFSRWFGRRSR